MTTVRALLESIECIREDVGEKKSTCILIPIPEELAKEFPPAPNKYGEDPHISVLAKAGGPVLKECSKCKLSKEVSAVNFYKDRASPGGFRPDCKVCCAKGDATKRVKHHARIKTEKARYYEKNKETIKKKSREWHAGRDPSLVHAENIGRNYGLSARKYDEMYTAQGGLCAICREPETRLQRGKVVHLPVDHDHATGRVRALLCHRCNLAVGALEHVKNPRSIVDYLEEQAKVKFAGELIV